MATAQDFENFEDSLQKEIAWRKKEMINLLLNAQSAAGEAQKSAIRSGIVLVYAHFEGFIRGASRRYFEFVTNEGLRYRELGINFLSVKVSRLVNQETTKASYYDGATRLLVTRLDEAADLPRPEVISARSNLNFDQLTEMLYCINLDSSPFELRKNFIDLDLLEKRNAIAHGEFRDVDLGEYEQLHTGVMDIIEQFSDLLKSSVSCRNYRGTYRRHSDSLPPNPWF